MVRTAFSRILWTIAFDRIVRAASDVNFSVCEVGEVAQLPETECLPCPDGLSCPGGAVAPSLLPGYYSSPEEPLSVYKCADQYFAAEEACPGGPIGTCAERHNGLACSVCDGGYYWIDGWCVPCYLGIVTFLIAIIIGTISAYVTYVLILRVLVDDNNWAKLAMKCLGDFLLLVQVTAASDQIHPMLGFTIYDPFAFGLECLGLSGGGGGIAGFVIAIFVFPMFLQVVGLSVHALRQLCSDRYIETLKNAAAQKTARHLTHEILFLGMFAATCYVPVSVFRCYAHPNGKTSLYSHPHVLCYSDIWKSKMTLAFISGLATLGLFAIFCYLSDKGRMADFQSLRLKPDKKKWLGPLLCRNWALVLAPVLLAEQGIAGGFSSCVALGGLGMLLVGRVYRYQLLALVEIPTSVCVSVISFRFATPVLPIVVIIMWCISVGVLIAWKGRDGVSDSTKLDTGTGQTVIGVPVTPVGQGTNEANV